MAVGSGRDGRCCVSVPQRGDKKALLELAERNASLSYDARFNEEGAANYEALETLQAALGLPALPRRIDCFDISTLQGAETVASMVVCQDGRMKRSEYRKYRIKGRVREPGIGNRESGRPGTGNREPAIGDRGPGCRAVATGRTSKAFGAEGTYPMARRPKAEGRKTRRGGAEARFLDDFAAMNQVVTRRYRKVADEDGPWPDLIVIDGGKGQLNAAYEALEALGLDHLVAVGLAKQEELVFTRDRDEPDRVRRRDARPCACCSASGTRRTALP